jgi:hypothetical protein
VDAEQFASTITSLHSPYKDVSLIAEGRCTFVGSQEHTQNAYDYQTLYVYRSDIAIFQDLFITRSDPSGMLQRTTSAYIRGTVDEFERWLDQNKGQRASWSCGPTHFSRTGSPSMFFFLWYFAYVKDPQLYGYESRGWEEIDGHNCLRIRLFLNKILAGAKPGQRYYELFWIDMERGGQVLKHEVRKGDDTLVRRIDKIELELMTAEDGMSLWIPVAGESNTFSSDGKVSSRETYRVVQGTVLLNQGITDEKFSVDWDWVNPGETADMKTLRSKKVSLPAKEKFAIDPASVERRLNRLLAQADSQAERLEASSAARQTWGWAQILQVTCVLIGFALLGSAAWFKLKKT